MDSVPQCDSSGGLVCYWGHAVCFTGLWGEMNRTFVLNRGNHMVCTLFIEDPQLFERTLWVTDLCLLIPRQFAFVFDPSCRFALLSGTVSAAVVCYQSLGHSLLVLAPYSHFNNLNKVQHDESICENLYLLSWRTAKLSDMVLQWGSALAQPADGLKTHV